VWQSGEAAKLVCVLSLEQFMQDRRLSGQLMLVLVDICTVLV